MVIVLKIFVEVVNAWFKGQFLLRFIYSWLWDDCGLREDQGKWNRVCFFTAEVEFQLTAAYVLC
jgi:hypothetical protein